VSYRRSEANRCRSSTLIVPSVVADCGLFELGPHRQNSQQQPTKASRNNHTTTRYPTATPPTPISHRTRSRKPFPLLLSLPPLPAPAVASGPDTPLPLHVRQQHARAQATRPAIPIPRPSGAIYSTWRTRTTSCTQSPCSSTSSSTTM
jgi:hypothetical protein